MDANQNQAQIAKPEDVDVWEFVTCAKCQLAFSPDGISGPTVPFWITECGHVLCNAHLSKFYYWKTSATRRTDCAIQIRIGAVRAARSKE